jgi:hypothetical protein
MSKPDVQDAAVRNRGKMAMAVVCDAQLPACD